jgi:hypothetical protein
MLFSQILPLDIYLYFIRFTLEKIDSKLGVVAHTCDPSIWEAKAR